MRLLLVFLISPYVSVVCAAQVPTWEDLEHPVPEWLLDAKFGLYAHWGPASVPAFQTEWYAKRMYDTESEVYRHHVEAYGDPAEFGYKSFIPMFKAERFDPSEWAALARASGARFAGLAVVHHDGFLLWDSDVSRWNAADMGPKRDLFGEYAAALREEDLKVLATFHHIRTFNWFLPGTGGFGEITDSAAVAEVKDRGWDLADPEYGDLYWNSLTGGTYDAFIAEWKEKVLEVMGKYRPDVVWFDGGRFRNSPSESFVRDLLGRYHDMASGWGKEVEVLNKLPVTGVFNFPRTYGMLTFEEGRDRLPFVDFAWIDDMRIGDPAWCYVEGQTYKPAREVLHGLIDRVARGGGLVLNLSPRSDGTFPEAQTDVLYAVGEWLDKNGEAIYATRPWKVQSEGGTRKLIGYKWQFAGLGASDIRFTRSKDGLLLYAIALGWPEEDILEIKTLSRQTRIADGGIKRIELLGECEQEVEWTRDAERLTILLPERTDRNAAAYAFRIVPEGRLLFD